MKHNRLNKNLFERLEPITRHVKKLLYKKLEGWLHLLSV